LTALKIPQVLSPTLTLGQEQHGKRRSSKRLEHESYEKRVGRAMIIIMLIHLASPRPTNKRKSTNRSSPKPSDKHTIRQSFVP